MAAIGLIFSPDASNFSRQLSSDDVWTGWRQNRRLPVVKIQAALRGFETNEEKGLVAKWLVKSQGELEARITYEYRPAVEPQGRLPDVLPIDDYDWVIYGGETERERIDFKDLARIRLEFLHALRDAQREMSWGRHRRVGSLISRFKPKGFDDEDRPDKRKVSSALRLLNRRLERAEPITESQDHLNRRLVGVSGETNAQRAVFSPSKLEFDDLVRNLQVLVGPRGVPPHAVELNGLGYNNLLYVAALLTDFYRRREIRGGQAVTLPIVAMEEPEAHLHPHLQKFLNRYFATGGDGQVIVTTHSTHVSSSVDPSHIVVLHAGTTGDIRATSVGTLYDNTPAGAQQLNTLSRYLDATRSTLFFGKSVMLVEGLAEAILLPVIAKECLEFDVDDRGISVVAVQGISFRPFAALFGPRGIQRRCAILADSDPANEMFPLSTDDPDYQPSQRVLNLQSEMDATKGGFVRVFNNLKTLEHDIIACGNRELVEAALITASQTGSRISPSKAETVAREDDIKAFSHGVLQAISRAKGEFAQTLAQQIAEAPAKFRVPDYISEAFAYLAEGDGNGERGQ